MEAQVETYNSNFFEDDFHTLSFKESNFTFKQTRNLVEMIKSRMNISHLVKLEKNDFEKPLYLMKIMKDLRVILILEEYDSSPQYIVTFLRIIRLNQLEETLESLEIEAAYSALSFSDFFW